MKEFGRKVLGFFLSVRTAVWLTLALIVFLLFGAVVMPGGEPYDSMNSLALFTWMSRVPVSASWWLFGAIAALSLLTANTLLCSVESLLKKRSGRDWLLVISPQIIHIGFLFILLAHLLSSGWAAHGMARVPEGARLGLENGVVIEFKEIGVKISKRGYPESWHAVVDYLSDGKVRHTARLEPNRPSFKYGLGVYLKEVRPSNRGIMALIEVSREPGAPWALLGAVLFSLGTVALIVQKIRLEH